MSIYTDENGYKRHSNLVHRQKAYEQIYLKNRDKYPLPFSEYVVHHIDGDKTNNRIENLQLLTEEEHKDIHGFEEESEEDDHFNSLYPVIKEIDSSLTKEFIYLIVPILLWLIVSYYLFSQKIYTDSFKLYGLVFIFIVIYLPLTILLIIFSIKRAIKIFEDLTWNRTFMV